MNFYFDVDVEFINFVFFLLSLASYFTLYLPSLARASCHPGRLFISWHKNTRPVLFEIPNHILQGRFDILFNTPSGCNSEDKTGSDRFHTVPRYFRNNNIDTTNKHASTNFNRSYNLRIACLGAYILNIPSMARKQPRR